MQCGHRCFRQRWRARIFIFILRRSDRAHHPSPSAAVAARNSSTVSVQAAPTRADRIGKTSPRVRPVQRPQPSGSPPLRSSPQILDSRASRSRAFLCGRRGKAGAFNLKSARIGRTRRGQPGATRAIANVFGSAARSLSDPSRAPLRAWRRRA